MKKLDTLSQNKTILRVFYISSAILLVVSIVYFFNNYFRKQSEQPDQTVPVNETGYRPRIISDAERQREDEINRNQKPREISETERLNSKKLQSTEDYVFRIISEEEKRRALEMMGI